MSFVLLDVKWESVEDLSIRAFVLIRALSVKIKCSNCAVDVLFVKYIRVRRTCLLRVIYNGNRIQELNCSYRTPQFILSFDNGLSVH